MDFIYDQKFWVLFSATTVAVIISAQLFFHAIQLKETNEKKDKLKAYSLFMLSAGFLINTPIIFFFGRKASVYCFGGSLLIGLLSFVIRYINDQAKTATFQSQIRKTNNREEIRSLFLQKMNKDIQFRSYIKKYSLTEEDLDDYFEVLSLGWPLEELLSVLTNERVLRTYFDAKDISKGELLEKLKKMRRTPK